MNKRNVFFILFLSFFSRIIVFDDAIQRGYSQRELNLMALLFSRSALAGSM